MRTKQDREYDIVELKLSHSFALKMAMMICWSVVSIIMMLGIFYGAVTPIAIGLIVTIAIILGIISFSATRSACL